MTFKIGTAIQISYYTGVTGSTVNYKVQDESGNLETSGSLVEDGNITGLYQGSFNPDAAGIWTVIITSGTSALAQSFPVGFGTISDATYGLSAIHTDLATVDGLLDVPTADASTNATMRDALGNKEDAAVTTAGTTKSVVAYLKGCLSQLATIVAKTNLIPTSPATSTDATTAITTYDLDHVAKATYGATKPTDGSLFDLVMNKDSGQTFDATTDSLEAIQEAVAALSGGSLADSVSSTHDVTTANDTAETQLFEYSSSEVYNFSVYLDLDALETAAEGGVITTKLYNKVDGSNYSDIPSAVSVYTIGVSTEYPSFEANMLMHATKVTIQCSENVTATRTISYKYLYKQVS